VGLYSRGCLWFPQPYSLLKEDEKVLKDRGHRMKKSINMRVNLDIRFIIRVGKTGGHKGKR
jgi:hypothetical protein